MISREFPSVVKQVSYGKALFAKQDLSVGTVVERFVGKQVQYEDLTKHDKTYVLCTESEPGNNDWIWLLAESDAKYANHSCDPNCRLTPSREIVTIKPVKENEELTFYYLNGTESDFWDPAWNFECYCGSKHCLKKIDRYVPLRNS
ncbi:hypothetical protein EDD86DRAFT_119552 [Gorgonomyces haynaldii]|nr:hypothetical protein EDD86DRAFT_119552 [Gorgonomyces haynaldii]